MANTLNETKLGDVQIGFTRISDGAGGLTWRCVARVTTVTDAGEDLRRLQRGDIMEQLTPTQQTTLISTMTALAAKFATILNVAPS